MDASMLTRIRKNRAVYANYVDRKQTIANGCRPFLTPQSNGANDGGYLAPVLWAGEVETTKAQNELYKVSVPNCSAGGSSSSGPTPRPANCYNTIPGLIASLDATDPLGTGVLPPNGSTLTNWADISNVGTNSASVPTTGGTFVGPVFQTISLNGLPGVVFTNENAPPSAYQALTLPSAVTTNNYTIFVVGQYFVSVPPIIVPAMFSIYSQATGIYLLSNPTDIQISDVPNSTSFSLNWRGGPANDGTSYIFSYAANGNRKTTGLDGLLGTQTTGIASPAGPLTIGVSYNDTGTIIAGTGANCVINEFLVYNRALSEREIETVEICLSQKWGIPTPCIFTTVPNLCIWMDATDPLGGGIPPPADTAPVPVWTNLSTGGQNAIAPVQAGVIAAPTYDSSYSYNAPPNINFINDNFPTDPYQTMLISNAVTSNNFSLFFVGSFGNFFVNLDTGSMLSGISTGGSTTFTTKLTGLTLSSPFVNVPWPGLPLSNTNKYLFTIISSSSGTSINVYRSGVADNGTGQPMPFNTFSLGLTYINAATQTDVGDCGLNQIVAYDRVVTPTERAAIERCIGIKWGL